MVADPLSALVVHLKNAQNSGKGTARIIFSNQILAVLKIFKKLGYVSEIKQINQGKKKFLEIFLNPNQPIEILKRVSKPGRRIYVGYRELYSPLSGRGLAIISTSEGIMTDIEARKKKLGGEYLMMIG